MVCKVIFSSDKAVSSDCLQLYYWIFRVTTSPKSRRSLRLRGRGLELNWHDPLTSELEGIMV
ncbi:MAG: hypothetical protein K6U80_18945 [Firmicutes bacterium]|nr:hypothetical protein [Bacillota bacterium]